MENAVIQIQEFISGNQSARIECEDEGELYRLFHEVNSLAVILNAHAENEGKSKKLYLSGDDSIFLSCDRIWFIEAISNIIKNALDHTEKDDFIRIEWRAFPSVI